ncbi:MAG: rod shape-determining protein MreC [Clostridia bacterium]|nr:rod shape-determining protein MreC [Clostridia bacterium]
MKQFLKSKRFRVFITVLAVLFVSCVASSVLTSRSSPINVALGTIFEPFQKFASDIRYKIDDIVLFGSADKYEQQIEELKKELSDCREKLTDYDEISYKLASYEKMLGIKKKNPDYELVFSNIIGTDAQDLFSTLILDKGETDSVAVNDPVVYGKYVIGVVRSVKPTYCVVKTLLDPSVNMAAYETKTRETGFINTSAQYALKNTYRLCGLSRITKVKKGSLICTSGTGGVFPKNFIIGTVDEITYSDENISGIASVIPGISISDLQDVFIITDFEGQGVEEIED